LREKEDRLLKAQRKWDEKSSVYERVKAERLQRLLDSVDELNKEGNSSGVAREAVGV
jgi:hypothetical protein